MIAERGRAPVASEHIGRGALLREAHGVLALRGQLPEAVELVAFGWRTFQGGHARHYLGHFVGAAAVAVVELAEVARGFQLLAPPGDGLRG